MRGPRGVESGHGERVRGQAARDRRRGGVLVGAPEREEHGGAGGGADGECEEHLARQLHREHELEEDEQREHDGPGAPPAPAHERRQDHERGGERGQRRGRERLVEADPGALGELVDRLGRCRAVEPLDRRAHHPRRQELAEDQIAEQPEAAKQERRQQERDLHRDREDLGKALEDPLGGRLQEVQELEDVRLEPEDRVLRPPGERQQCDRRDRIHDEPQQVGGRPLVADRVLLEARFVGGHVVGGDGRLRHGARSLARPLHPRGTVSDMTSGIAANGDGVSEMRAWRLHEYGRPRDVLALETVPVPEPDAGEVRVSVQAIPLNLNDLERITGGNMVVRPELPYSPGMEVMGVVDACGAGAERWQGARVVAMPKQAYGGYAEFAICPSVSVFEMPDSVPLPDAAALYFPFHLAWLGLFDRAGLQAGETVLIHAAAGGSGSAAVQLAVHAGARVFATAGSAEKVALCRELGAHVAIDYTQEDFAEVVLRETDGRGVDVVFDNVGPAVMADSFKCTAYNGRYLLMGFASDKTKADEPSDRPPAGVVGQLQALRRAPRLRAAGDRRPREAGHGLQLPHPRARRADDRVDPRARRVGRGAPGDRPGCQLRRRACRHRGARRPADGRPHRHHALTNVAAIPPSGR